MHNGQKPIYNANEKENAKHVDYDCVIGDKVMDMNMGAGCKAKDKNNSTFTNIYYIH